MAPQKDYNALAGQRYRSEFGSNRVYFLSSEAEKDKKSEEQKSRTTASHDHQVLFGADVTFSKLASLISKGAKTKQTNISDSFSYDDYRKQYGKRATPLFAFNAKRQLRFFTDDMTLMPSPGWTITALIQEEDSQKSPANT
jgi:hypothetical protein